MGDARQFIRLDVVYIFIILLKKRWIDVPGLFDKNKVRVPSK